MNLLTSCNDTNWIDSVSHTQILVLFSSFMMLVTVLYSHIVLCLDNRASAWHGQSVAVCGHSLLQQSLTVAFQKASTWVAAGASLFQPSPKYSMKSIYRCPAWAGCRLKTFYCLFSDHQQTAMQTQGSCLFQRMTKVPVHVEHSGTKQLKQCTDKDSPVSLTCMHHHQTHRAETRQTACVLR